MDDAPNREVAVFTEALQLPLDQRARFLDQACAGDAELRRRVESFLQAHDRVGTFLEHGPTEVAGRRHGVAEQPGDRIGHYKLLQQIGEGGCGVVYMAEQEAPVRRRVALKIIKPGMDTKSVIARFEAERQALALMDHPNIAKVFDAGSTESGRPYFVMELVRGVKITEYCDQNSLTTGERLKLFVQVCQAVQHAHQKGIIHRDLKPSNILVTKTLEGAPLPVVIDFGIAKATTSQRLTDKTLFTAFEMLIGTPAYMSPEQAALTSVDVDTRTDIYSLGVLLYELLTGSTPFDAGQLLKSGLDEIRRVIREDEPVRPSTRLGRLAEMELTTVAQSRRSEAPLLIRSVRGDLDWIAMKALEKDRTRRYQTANGLARDVERFLADETISARPPSTLYRFQKTVRRHKLLFGALAVIAILLVSSLIVGSASLAKERLARREAQTESSKSQQITRFLKEMLQGVGPSVAMGQDTAMLKGILDKTAERVGRDMAGQPAIEAELRGMIGQLYTELGTYEAAEKMLLEALALNRKLTGPESLESAASLNDLGMAYWKERKLAEAEIAHREALKIRRRMLGSTHPDVATSLYNLACVYRRQHKLAESEALTLEAMEIRKKKFGSESVEVAETMHNLCVVLGDEGRRSESEATAREMLAMRRKLLGNQNAAVAAALNDLAWALGFNGQTAEAEALEKEALEIQLKLLGDQHPDVAKSLASFGERMRQRGNLSESQTVLTAALSIQRKLLGADHPDSLSSLQSLGWAFEGEGKWAEAEAAHRESLVRSRGRAGMEDPQTLEAMNGLVRVLLAEGKVVESEQLLKEVLTPSYSRQPSAVRLLALRVELMGRQGRWPEALESAKLTVELQPAEHYRYHTLAALLAVTRDQTGYEALCRRMLTNFSDTLNPYVAERIAQACLHLPQAGVDLATVAKMADRSVLRGSSEPGLPFFQLAKAMAGYRQGRYPEAIEWAEKSLTGKVPEAHAKAYAVLAMARWRSGDLEGARNFLAKGEALAPSFASDRGPVNVGESWLSWLSARISLDEAKGLVQSVQNLTKP